MQKIWENLSRRYVKPDGPVSAEVVGLTKDEMVEQGKN